MSNQRFSNEVYSLFLENLDKRTLLKCSCVSRDFWLLSRPRIFRKIRLVYDFHLPTPPHVRTFLHLLQNNYSILKFIEIFSLELDRRYDSTKFNSDLTFVTTVIIELLCHAPKLCEIEIDPGRGTWSELPEVTQKAFNALFHLPNLRSLSLKYLHDVPTTILKGTRIECLELEDCKRSLDSTLITGLSELKELYVDATFLDSFIHATAAFPNLKIIELSGEPDLNKASPLFRACAQTLEELSIFYDCT